MKRRKAREYTVQLLYMLDTAGASALQNANGKDLIQVYTQFYRPEKETITPDDDFWLRLLNGALAQMPKIDQMLESQSDHWKLQRMTRVDRSILRMAVAELMSFPEIPPSVSFDEALEIAKRFGTEESAPFVNGVLDNLWKKLEATTPKAPA